MTDSHPAWWGGSRGEWYVVAQFVLFGLVAFGPRSLEGAKPWPAPIAGVAVWIGAALMISGCLFLLAAARRLGPSLTPLPAPKPDSSFVEHGPYALVRHPIYSGVLLVAFGWATVVQGTLTLGYAAVLAVLLDRKAAREERWLIERYPAYQDYRRRVRKLIPFVY
ncbi:MAG: isoprenylcysteine carboxylmethyltransferase family protein [Gemmatimonadales bacterium]|nr:isoprenylcysteine carboxylmethyltransferase family protein [Gemmatimonadales bacterium]